LASLNVLRFLNDSDFNAAAFTQAVRVFIVAQDILVGRADYPTEKVGENARRFRQLGLGYANLGASLMTMGYGYESSDGRGFAAALTALMTGTAYKVSTELAMRVGAFDGYEANAEAMSRVLNKHLGAALLLERPDHYLDVAEMIELAVEAFRKAWESCRDGAGVRNSQVSVLAPTGTISFLMGCDTTGVEPAFGLVTYKTLVGGGSMSLPVNTVEAGLQALGYGRGAIEKLLAHVAETGEITGALEFKPEHADVFATAVGSNAVSPLGHVRMVAAVQPFLSGGVSKTVNLPAEATVEDIESVFMEGWKLGVKCLAVYRDGCKTTQPLTTKSSDEAKVAAAGAVAEAGSAVVVTPTRRRLPRRRNSRTTQFKIGEVSGYFTVGHYDDGQPGELFLKVAKQGSTLSGVLDALAISVSLGLQNGVPLVEFVRKFTHLRFEPAGLTNDEELRFATSILDHVFSRLALDYLPAEERADIGVFSTAEKAVAADGHGTVDPEIAPAARASHRALALPGSFDGPVCSGCGTMMVRTGTCWACPSCGASGGC
jgi:ribonucleoside-diphosphate reductase alpha chain